MRKRGAKVYEIETPYSDVVVPLRLDKEKWEFVAIFADVEVASKDPEEVIAQIRLMVSQHNEMAWKPVIYVYVNPSSRKHLGPGSFSPQVAQGLSVAGVRFYYAVGRDDRLYQLSWDSYEAEAWDCLQRFTPEGLGGWQMRDKVVERFSLPYSYCKRAEYPHDNYYFAYDEDLWNGIVMITEALASAKDRLQQLVRADRLMLIGRGGFPPLLQAPVDLEEDDGE